MTDFSALEHVGNPVLALTLMGKGARTEFGAAYQKIFDDLEAGWGLLFTHRNDNGRIRKLTKAARGKERDKLSPSAAEHEVPIVLIDHFAQGDLPFLPVSPRFQLLYASDEIRIELHLDMEDDVRAQAESLRPMVQAWLDDFPLVYGTISPALAQSDSYSSTIEFVEFLDARIVHPGVQFISAPAMARSLDGLGNWGEITLLGKDIVQRMGGPDALRQSAPGGIHVEVTGQCAVLSASDKTSSLACTRLSDAHRTNYSDLARFLAPQRCSVYSNGHMPTEEWDRLTVDWSAVVPVRMFHPSRPGSLPYDAAVAGPRRTRDA